MSFTELRLTSGERLVVNEALSEAEKALSDAARSGQSRLAWFKEADTDEAVGVNPACVASIRAVPDSS